MCDVCWKVRQPGLCVCSVNIGTLSIPVKQQELLTAFRPCAACSSYERFGEAHDSPDDHHGSNDHHGPHHHDPGPHHHDAGPHDPDPRAHHHDSRAHDYYAGARNHGAGPDHDDPGPHHQKCAARSQVGLGSLGRAPRIAGGDGPSQVAIRGLSSRIDERGGAGRRRVRTLSRECGLEHGVVEEEEEEGEEE